MAYSSGIRENILTMKISVYQSYIIWSVHMPSIDMTLILFTAVPVEIVTHPESATRLVGSSATFSCSASGTPPLTFTWYKDGAPLVAGGSVSINNQPNDSSLTLTNIASSDAGAYYCVASNDLVAGIFSANSSLATLTVQGMLIILLDLKC